MNGTETIAVAGPALLRFKEGKDLYDFEVPPGQVYKFVIPPGITHAIKNTGAKTNILVAFNTIGHDARNPDVVSDLVLDE